MQTTSNYKPNGAPKVPAGGVTAILEESPNWFLDSAFQNKLVALLIYDKDTLEKCASLLSADDFRPQKGVPDARPRWLVAERALEYFEKHGQPIDRHIRADVLEYASNLNLGSMQVNELRAYLKELQSVSLTVPDAITEKVIAFKSQSIRRSILDELSEMFAAGTLDNAKLEEALQRMQVVSDRKPDPLLEVPQWPVRLDWDSPVWYGVGGEIVKALDPLTEADPIAVLSQFLAGFGCLIGHKPYLMLGSEQHTNFHTCLVGNTGEGRKGTALDRALQVLKWIEPEFVRSRCFGGVASGQAMIKQVCDDFYRRDKTGTLALVQAGVDDKRWLMTEHEFGRTLTMCRSEGSILSHVIREGFDSGNMRNTSLGNPLQATAAHISLIGHITPGELSSLIRNTTLHLNGFCNRIMFICCIKSKELRRGGHRTVPGWKNFRERLRATYEWARKVDRVEWSKKALDLWSTEGYDEVTRVHGNGMDEIANRGNAIVPRIASVQALLNHSVSTEPGKALIRPEHLRAALAMWRYSVESDRFIFGSATNTLNADASKVLAVLKSRGTASRSELALYAFQNNDAKRRLESTLPQLQRKGLVRLESVKTEGRNREIWSPVTGG